LPYPQQLQRKQQTVSAALQPYPELQTLSRNGTLSCRGTDQTTGYRMRAKLVCDGPALGLFDAEHHVVDIPECRILRPAVKSAVAAVRASLPLPFRLLALDVREVDEGVLVTWIVPPNVAEATLRAAAELLVAREPRVLGVSFSERPIDSPRVLGTAPRPLLGLMQARHHLDPKQPFQVAVAGGFVQSHAAQTSALHSRVEQHLARVLGAVSGKRILELYAGSGALALRLAKSGAEVTAVDSYVPNLERLQACAGDQGLRVHAEAEAAEAVLRRSDTKDAHWDAVIVDPPRRGLHPDVRMGIAHTGARCLILISCEPRTLARDLSHLRRLGYAPSELEPWDLLPQSDAVEALVCLEPVAPLPAEVLFEDERLIAVNKPPFLPTTPQGEHTTSLLDFVRRLPGAANAVPVHRLDIDTSGVCLFAREPHFVEALSKGLSAGQKTYTALAQGTLHKRGIIRRKLREAGRWILATTRYVLAQRVGTHSLLHVHPEHGRKHQIRRHLSGLGHPVLGDTRYGKPATNRHFEERHGLDRTFLHCSSIQLELDAGPLLVQAPLSADLQAVITSLSAARSEP
jgi:23S rRNA (uracil1939-C5)-methyltransferase